MLKFVRKDLFKLNGFKIDLKLMCVARACVCEIIYIIYNIETISRNFLQFIIIL